MGAGGGKLGWLDFRRGIGGAFKAAVVATGGSWDWNGGGGKGGLGLELGLGRDNGATLAEE